MENNRQLQILTILLREKKTTVKKLAEKLEVHVRTIERNIERLIANGVPIVTKKGRNGGVYIEEGYKWDREVFTDTDLLLIFLALHIFDHLIESGFKDYMVQKMMLVNPDVMSFIEEMVEKYFSIDIFDKPIKIDVTVDACIRQAFLRGCFVNIKLLEGDIKVYPIEYILKANGMFLYVFNEEYMLISVTAIKGAELCEELVADRDKIVAYGDEKNIRVIE